MRLALLGSVAVVAFAAFAAACGGGGDAPPVRECVSGSNVTLSSAPAVVAQVVATEKSSGAISFIDSISVTGGSEYVAYMTVSKPNVLLVSPYFLPGSEMTFQHAVEAGDIVSLVIAPVGSTTGVRVSACVQLTR